MSMIIIKINYYIIIIIIFVISHFYVIWWQITLCDFGIATMKYDIIYYKHSISVLFTNSQK